MSNRYVSSVKRVITGDATDERASAPPKHVRLAPQLVTIDPVTRIEGHMKVEVAIDTVGGVQQVVDAWSTGTAFRGLESILVNRHPWDAIPITQRICGVCPVSHGLAASLAIQAATGISPPNNGRILQNLVLGANFLQSHILHFYHLAILDYLVGPDMAPWQPHWESDLRLDATTTTTLVEHYTTALAMRRKAHEMGAVFGGRLPHPPSYVPGGFTCKPTAARRATFSTYLNELITFVQDTYIPDVQVLGSAYSDYYVLGAGNGNLLAYGAFDQDSAGSVKLLARGRIEDGSHTVLPVDLGAITEHVTYSWYDQSTNNLPPASGETRPDCPKCGAYSWLKAPRYAAQTYEVGPLARMWVNGDYRNGTSVMDRHMARALETLKVAQAMQAWLAQLADGSTAYTNNTPPSSGSGVGLTEASRGALGHWLQISNGQISRYQVITPTCWNASPRDSAGVRGPIEQALRGTPVLDIHQPVEVLRVIHSYDPCLSCSVHVLRPDRATVTVIRRP